MSLANASEIKLNGKRPRDETDQPECESPTKETKTEPKTDEPKNQDTTEDDFYDCKGCIVVMCANEEPDAYHWFAVPESKFNEDLKLVADRFGFKGDSMIQYLRQAHCVGEEDKPLEEQEEGDAMTDVFMKWHSAGYSCHVKRKEVCTRHGYRLAERMAQLKNVGYFVSIDIFE